MFNRMQFDTLRAAANTTDTPSMHRINHEGFGYAGALDDEQIARVAPSIFAEAPHDSRSDRYTYVPTVQLLAGMRGEGFLPVMVQQAKSREDDRRGFAKHLIRFRREDQLNAAEAREVVLVNSHDGTSSFQLMAGIFRLVCANGLILGGKDSEIRVPHKGDILGRVIEGAYSVVNNFDRVTAAIEDMKAIDVAPEAARVFAKAALALRYDEGEEPVKAETLLRVKRVEDSAPTLWNTFNVVQEHMLKGGDRGWKKDANGRTRRASTREIKGIDQGVGLNKALWVLAEEFGRMLKAA